jgi:predicted hotdog family 3-hydroxylacyl-ACP dehydratase
MSVAIEKLIPHRAPMLWISELTSCTETTASATASFGENSYAVVDGRVLETALVECIAQTVGGALGQRARDRDGESSGPASGMLVATSNFKIHSRPAAGKTLHIEFRETRRLGPMRLVTGTIVCDGQVIAAGDLSLYA